MFTQRSQGLRQHPGQPAFPGGAIEDADSGPAAAALREAAEEAGVKPGDVEVLATPPELFIAYSGFRAAPSWRGGIPRGRSGGGPREAAAADGFASPSWPTRPAGRRCAARPAGSAWYSACGAC